jgi:hypothetical protein
MDGGTSRSSSAASATARASVELTTLPPRTSDRIYVLRGLLRQPGHLADTGSEMPTLMKRITSTQCPVAMALTEADKSNIAAALDQVAKSR